MNSLNYRPEINGLRGIAILWVTIFHFEKIILDSNIFQGGYIGVDIFFVISGYLISTIIFKELKIKGNFSYKNFYTRRVKIKRSYWIYGERETFTYFKLSSGLYFRNCI